VVASTTSARRVFRMALEIASRFASMTLALER
jgi:hypothetical protein